MILQCGGHAGLLAKMGKQYLYGEHWLFPPSLFHKRKTVPPFQNVVKVPCKPSRMASMVIVAFRPKTQTKSVLKNLSDFYFSKSKDILSFFYLVSFFFTYFLFFLFVHSKIYTSLSPILPPPPLSLLPSFPA